ncbi:MAG: ammonium transporter [Coriobacteriia bacterium]
MPSIDTGDTAFMLVSAALVLFMTPGLALFYAGMVRRKNVLSTTMHSFFAMGLVSLLWAVAGYTIAFGSASGKLGAFVGGFDALGLKGVVTGVTGTIPTSVFAMYQGMFAIITVGLITGAVAERMRFSAYVLFATLWALLVYSPLAHWVWGGGWLARFGALDFAGGTVVHIASAAAALACALALGKRKGHGTEELRPHNVPMTVLGAGILWFGWFGFNAGSALASGTLAGSAFMATHLAAASGLVAWCAVEKLRGHRPTTLGAASGAVAGLVGITPAAGFVGPMSAIVIGLAAGTLCFFGLMLKDRFGFDDALDVVGVHGVGGTTGALLTGVFASRAINAAGADGLWFGDPTLILKQLVGVVATIVFSFTVSWVILKAIDATVGLRVDTDAEEMGLDLAEHTETGYVF